MCMPRVLFTIHSENRKTGNVPVGMTDRSSCPTSCRSYLTCYARGGTLGITWSRLNKGTLPGMNWDTFCAAVAGLKRSVNVWRMNQAGDLPGANNRLDREACLQLCAANVANGYSRGGFTYTHYSPVMGVGVDPETAAYNLEVIQSMNAAGFAVNLSGDSLAHADQLVDLGIGPVVSVLPRDQLKGTHTAKGRTVMVCPAVVKDGVTCKSCKLCQRIQRKVIIGFPAHGFAIQKMSVQASTLGTF